MRALSGPWMIFFRMWRRISADDDGMPRVVSRKYLMNDSTSEKPEICLG